MSTVGMTRAVRIFRQLMVVLAVAAVDTGVSWADPIKISFLVRPAPGDPVNPGPSAGSFTFDSSLVPPGEGLLSDPGGLASSVDFFWGSTQFDITTADVVELRFDESGALVQWLLGGRSLGLAAWFDQPAERVVDDFVLSPQGFFYTLQGRAGTWFTTVGDDNPPAPIPEPATWLLIVSGAVVLLAHRRSRRRHNRGGGDSL